MGNVIESVKVINNAARTLLAISLLGILGGGGAWTYWVLTEQQRKNSVAERELLDLQDRLGQVTHSLQESETKRVALEKEIAEKIIEIEKLNTSMQLLKVNQRLARLEVLGVEKVGDAEQVKSKVRFVELSPGGEPLSDGKVFEFDGDVIYIDNWVVQFDDKFVEAADIEKGTSLCLFRRIFSESQAPEKGFSLDEVGMRPQAYSRGGEMTDFEKAIWTQFWDIANDPDKAASMGIRAANGEAVSVKVRAGASYNIRLRASGGLTIEPIGDSASGS
jgi:hypothetical protein